MVKGQNYRWMNVLIGVVFLISGYISITNPATLLKTFVILFGIAALLRGFGIILGYSKIKEVTGKRSGIALAGGLLDIVFGILLLTNLGSGIILLGFLFALWFITDAISGLANLEFARNIGKKSYWFSLFVNIVYLTLGVMLLFDPIVAAVSMSLLVSIYFFAAGIQHIMLAFSNYE